MWDFVIFRGVQPVDGGGLGIEKPASLMKDDDEYDAYRKRMMLAYRFRPNPLVSSPIFHFCQVMQNLCIFKWLL